MPRANTPAPTASNPPPSAIARHCEGGGEDFFGREDRDGIFETGLRFAEDLADVGAMVGRVGYLSPTE